ncbi:MAG: hypothetical protein EOM05_07830 [Clostridia bacterium]|nr:hypothetical protein [Clostridia bacterium]
MNNYNIKMLSDRLFSYDEYFNYEYLECEDIEHSWFDCGCYFFDRSDSFVDEKHLSCDDYCFECDACNCDFDCKKGGEMDLCDDCYD